MSVAIIVKYMPATNTRASYWRATSSYGVTRSPYSYSDNDGGGYSAIMSHVSEKLSHLIDRPDERWMIDYATSPVKATETIVLVHPF